MDDGEAEVVFRVTCEVVKIEPLLAPLASWLICWSVRIPIKRTSSLPVTLLNTQIPGRLSEVPKYLEVSKHGRCVVGVCAEIKHNDSRSCITKTKGFHLDSKLLRYFRSLEASKELDNTAGSRT